MSKSILILDDDADFNNLLTDIFKQADYDVTSERDPENAVTVFQDKEFDLVVTDQKMPGLTGEEFIRRIKQMRRDIPVIMVSGYLDNDTIRELIKEGVGGVFLKPLNVFSLLKRTAALIEESEAAKKRESMREEGAPETLQYQHHLPFPFKTFPCKANKAVEFAKKLHSLRNFKANLIIIGENGTEFAQIVEDLKNFDEGVEEQFPILEHSQLQVEALLELTDQAEGRGEKRITLVIPDTHKLQGTHKRAIFHLSKKEAGFESVNLDVRFIFCLNDDIDSLYDRGEIDDDIYMFMGTSEVKVPCLGEIRDDIPIMAYSILKEEAASNGSEQVPSIDTTAKVYLHERDWPENTKELRRMMSSAFFSAKNNMLSREILENAMKKQLQAAAEQGAKGFKVRLEQFRDEYARAIYILCERDRGRAANVLQVEEILLDEMLGDFG